MTDGGIIDLTSFLMGGIAAESVLADVYTALSYPVEIPSVSGVVSCTWSKEEVRAISESPFTLQRQIYRHNGDRWRVSIVLPNMRREHALAWSSFLLSLDGAYGTFLFGDVFNPNPNGSAIGIPVIAGSANTGRVLATRGWEASTTNILCAGDKIQIGSYLYQVVRDVTSDINGFATLDIFPRLRATPNDGDAITTNSPRGLFQLANSNIPLCTFNLNGIATMPSFEIVEAI